MADNELSVIIKAKDLASKVVRGFENNLRSVVRTAKAVVTGLAALTTATAAGVVALGKLASRGRDYIAVQEAFNRITGGDGAQALERLQRQTNRQISAYELMSRANQAVTLGAVENVEAFGELAEASIALGRAQGVDARQALDSMVTGLGRLSNRRLDNLGIIVDQTIANERYAQELGKTVRQLTETEKAEAFRAEAMRQVGIKMEELGGLTRETGDLVSSLTTRIRDMLDQTSVWVNESEGIADFFRALENGLDMLEEKLPGILDKMGEFGTTILEMTGASDPALRAARQFAEGASQEQLRGRLEQDRQALDQALSRMNELTRQLDEAGLIDAEGRSVGEAGFRGPGLSGLDVLSGAPGQARQEVTQEQNQLAEELRTVQQRVATLDRVVEFFEGKIRDAGEAAGENAEATSRASFALASGAVGVVGPGFDALRARPTSQRIREMFQARGMAVPSRIAAPGITFPGQQAIAGRQNIAAGLGMFEGMPGGIPQAAIGAARGQMADLGFSSEEIDEFINSIVEGSGELNNAANVAIASFGGMAEAAIRGSQQMEQVVLRTFQNILQSLAQQGGPLSGFLGGFGVPIIGSVLGIASALFARSNRPQPVKVEEYSPRARQQMREDRGPDVVNVNLLDAEGNVLRTVQQIRRRSALDGVERLPRGA